MKTPRDAYNEEIIVGDIISYPVRKKSEMYLRTARVTDIFPTWDENGNSITKLKVLVAISPRKKERMVNKNWRKDIKLKEVVISKSWRTIKLSNEKIINDKRYNLLLENDSIVIIGEE